MTELSDRIKQTIESEDVVLFMKGTPERVFCGNSGEGARGAPVGGRTRHCGRRPPGPGHPAGALSALSMWPTIPQVFVRGKLVGGADIVEELAATGELRDTLDQRLGDGWTDRPREERVVELAAPAPFRLVQ